MLFAPRLGRLDARSLAGGQLGSWRRPYGFHPVSHDPLATAGAVVLDCRPQVLPGAMDVTSTDLAEILSTSRAGVAAEVPPVREQSFGGGGGDLLSLICLELGVTLPVDPGTDVEDKLPIPASPPADVDHTVVSACRCLCERKWIMNWNRCLWTLVHFRRW